MTNNVQMAVFMRLSEPSALHIINVMNFRVRWICVPILGLLLTFQTAALPTTMPVRKAANPSAGLVTAKLVEILARKPNSLRSEQISRAMELILEAGDTKAAIELLEIADPGHDRLGYVGELCTRLPGGTDGPAAKDLLAKHKAKISQVGTMESIAVGHARVGAIPPALLALAKLDDLGGLAFGRVLTMWPTAPVLKAYEAYARDHKPDADAVLLRAHLIVNHEGKTDELIRKLRESVKQPDSAASTNEKEIFRGLFFARLSRGEIDRAAAMEKERYTREIAAAANSKDKSLAQFQANHVRVEAYQAIVAAMCLKGDFPGAQKTIDELKHIPESSTLKIALSYAAGLKRDAAKVDALVKELEKSSGYPKAYQAAAWGAASAGCFASGDESGAKQFAHKGLTHIGGLSGDQEQALATLYMLAGMVVGPEAILFIEQPFDAFPIQLRGL